MQLFNNTTLVPDELEVDDAQQALHKLLLLQPYLEIHPSTAITYVVLVSVALTVGTLGNLVIIGAFGAANAVRTVGNEFIINLAISDLFVTAIADPLCILGVTHGRRYFDDRPLLCELIACLCLSACICAFFNLGLVTLNRYVYICHNKHYHSIFSRPKIIAMCVGAWVLAFAMEAPNFFGWGGHGFDMKNLQCIWMRMESFSYTCFLALFLIMGPLVLMTVAYLLIFLNIKASKKKVFSHGMMSMSAARKQEFKSTLKSARSLFVVVIAFLICWTPYAVITISDWNDSLPLGVHLWVTFLAHSHSSLNVFIHAMTNSSFRQASASFGRRIFGTPSSSTASSSGTGTTNAGTSPVIIKVQTISQSIKPLEANILSSNSSPKSSPSKVGHKESSNLASREATSSN